jgi:hypothetical protein
MLAHYADHTIDGDREIIQTTGREVFAGLLPEKTEQLIFRTAPLRIAASQ